MATSSPHIPSSRQLLSRLAICPKMSLATVAHGLQKVTYGDPPAVNKSSRVKASEESTTSERFSHGPFRFLDLPYDVRRCIYKFIYPTQRTLYLTMGIQNIRTPAPTEFRCEKSAINLLRASKQVKDEIYDILYASNTFVLNPELPDSWFPEQRTDTQLNTLKRYRDYLWHCAHHSPNNEGVIDHTPYGEPRWLSRDCFLTRMSPATCAKVRQLHLYLGDAVHREQLAPGITLGTIYLFPNVVVTSIPLFYMYFSIKEVSASETRFFHWRQSFGEQVAQRRKLRALRERIAVARAGQGGITVWDSLGESSCGGFFLMEGTEGFRYEQLEEDQKWWLFYKIWMLELPIVMRQLGELGTRNG